jgi:hypothetical protein
MKTILRNIDHFSQDRNEGDISMLLVNQFSVKQGCSLFLHSLVCCLLVMGIGIKNASAGANPACLGGPSECVQLYDSWNRDAVSNNPPTYPVFTITQTWVIHNINDYRNSGSGQDPVTANGSISLYDNNSGELIGSWAASSPNSSYGYTLWVAFPNVILNPGTYKIVDSDPASWSYSTTDYYHLPGDGPNWQPGVGFSAVYAVPVPLGKSFAAFIPRAEMQFGPNTKDDSFKLTGYFKLAADSNGISPLDEAVAIQFGTFSATIPAGSFQQDGQGFKYVDQAKHYGVWIQPRSGHSAGASIQHDWSQQPGAYQITVRADALDLDGTAVPPTVQLTIGDDQDQSKLDVGKAKFGKGKDGQQWVFHDGE